MPAADPAAESAEVQIIQFATSVISDDGDGTVGIIRSPLRAIVRPEQVAIRRSHAYGEQKRRAEGKDRGDEGSDDRPDDRRVQERCGRANSGIRAGRGEVAPHQVDHDQMHDERDDNAQAQQAGWPREGAADGVESVEGNERAAPDAEAGGEPPQAAGRDSARGQGRVPSVAASAGSTSTRASAIAPVRARSSISGRTRARWRGRRRRRGQAGGSARARSRVASSARKSRDRTCRRAAR
jgi:hypothetical protein